MSDRIVTIGSTGKDYTSIVLALAGEADFQAGEDNIIFEIDAGVYSSPIAVDTGFTTSSAHRVIFRNATGAFHNYTRGEGVRVIGAADWGTLIGTTIQYVDFIGIAARNTSTVIAHTFDINAANCRWINCFSYDRTSTTDSVGFFGRNGNPIAVNCAAVNCGVGFQNINSDKARWYNCIALNCSTYGFYDDTWGSAYWTNCYSGGSGTADYYKPHSTPDITTSFSEDETLSTSTITIANCGFTNSTAGSEDVSISSSSDFIDVGTDLSGDSTYPFDTDGFGTDRDANWDIGVMEYVASGGSSIVPIILAMNHFNGGM